MSAQSAPDRLEVVNGPEDGTEFPIARAPFDIGADPGCAVSLRLDRNVRHYHARATVVSDGYRIRRLGPGPVYVNGRRAGVVRSRVIRTGDLVQVGGTQLSLQCAPGGLASRSHGLPTESDIGWALRLLVRGAVRTLRGGLRSLRSLFGGFFWPAVAIGVVVLVLAIFRPWLLQRFWYQATDIVQDLIYRVRSLL